MQGMVNNILIYLSRAYGIPIYTTRKGRRVTKSEQTLRKEIRKKRAMRNAFGYQGVWDPYSTKQYMRLPNSPYFKANGYTMCPYLGTYW